MDVCQTYRDIVSIFREYMKDPSDISANHSITKLVSRGFSYSKLSESEAPQGEDLQNLVLFLISQKEVHDICNGTHRGCIRALVSYNNQQNLEDYVISDTESIIKDMASTTNTPPPIMPDSVGAVS